MNTDFEKFGNMNYKKLYNRTFGHLKENKAKKILKNISYFQLSFNYSINHTWCFAHILLFDIL